MCVYVIQLCLCMHVSVCAASVCMQQVQTRKGGRRAYNMPGYLSQSVNDSECMKD